MLGHFVLIVPFMELKLAYSGIDMGGQVRLNRTFYGIETVGCIVIG